MHVSIRPLTRQDVESVLSARRANRVRTLAFARQVGITQVIRWHDSGRAAKVHARKDNILVDLLSSPPEGRLRDALAFYLPIEKAEKQAGGPDYSSEYSLLPWLLRVEAHLEEGRLDLAFLELHTMTTTLGDAVVPDGLNPASDEYIDVEVTASPSA